MTAVTFLLWLAKIHPLPANLNFLDERHRRLWTMKLHVVSPPLKVSIFWNERHHVFDRTAIISFIHSQANYLMMAMKFPKRVHLSPVDLNFLRKRETAQWVLMRHTEAAPAQPHLRVSIRTRGLTFFLNRNAIYFLNFCSVKAHHDSSGGSTEDLTRSFKSRFLGRDAGKKELPSTSTSACSRPGRSHSPFGNHWNETIKIQLKFPISKRVHSSNLPFFF